MNKALEIKNWRLGGNNYPISGNSKNRWVGFQERVINQLKDNFGDDFNIVIPINPELEDDYYCIPFKVLKHVFIQEHMTTGKTTGRWTAIIKNNKFLMHGNQGLSVDISKYYAIPLIPEPTVSVDDDYYIENAKAEINIRLGQSKFRKGVLDNFNGMCALTGISETSLLYASHIIPWSHRKEFRGDILNGICFCSELDSLFDKGYISLTDELKIFVSNIIKTLSLPLQDKLIVLRDQSLRIPKKMINIEYLKYHRDNILLK